MGCTAVRGPHLAPALWQSPCMADDLTVRPIRAEEWRRVRDLRLAALQDPDAEIAFYTRYAEAAARMFELLMGNDVAPRKEFIIDGAGSVRDRIDV